MSIARFSNLIGRCITYIQGPPRWVPLCLLTMECPWEMLDLAFCGAFFYRLGLFFYFPISICIFGWICSFIYCHYSPFHEFVVALHANIKNMPVSGCWLLCGFYIFVPISALLFLADLINTCAVWFWTISCSN